MRRQRQPRRREALAVWTCEKSIALRHAGVSASSVSFSKAKLDDDDGRGVYEIDAHSGAILEASAEND